MKYHTLKEMQSLGAVEAEFSHAPMSRDSRLERWAELLEQMANCRLTTLRETEYQPAVARRKIRADDSPISIAFRDPALRAAGLAGDTYGDARLFFELTDRQLHDATCYCHFGSTVSGTEAARHVRALVGSGTGLIARLRAFFARR